MVDLSTLALRVSFFFTTYSKKNEVVDLFSELDAIKSGKYIRQIDECRKLYSSGDVLGYKKSKQNLPCITYSGVFNGPHRHENLHIYNGVLIFDVDNLPQQRLQSLKQLIFEDFSVIAVWVSPSGVGLKFLVYTNAESNFHKLVFEKLRQEFERRWEIIIDKSGSDVCRLCFVSYDSDILMRHSVVPMQVDLASVEDLVKIERRSANECRADNSDRVILVGNPYPHQRQNVEIAKRIFKYLTKNKLSITTSYNDWCRVAFAISNTFAYDVGCRLFLSFCSLDGSQHNEQRSLALINNAYRNRRVNEISFATIIYLAEQQGFLLNYRRGNSRTSRAPM